MRRNAIISALALVVLFGGVAFAQTTVNVTFIVNTSTVPDTLWPNLAVVQIRGEAPFTWDGTTPAVLTNIGGDYWRATVAIPPNTTVHYKLFTNASSGTGDNEHKGWEQDLNDGSNNRVLLTGTTDTTLAVEFVNGSASKQDQYWRPWNTGQDSISVRVRVNMQGWESFNAASDMVGVRGAAYPDYLGNLSWAHTLFLTKEDQHGNSGSRQYNADNFYSGTVKIPRDSVAEYQTIEYKFVIMTGSDPDAGPKTWESVSNRTFPIPVGKADTTLLWQWFDNVRPAPFVGSDTVTINYSVDMTKAIQSSGYTPGDTLLVQSGWAGSGRDLTDKSPTRTILTKQGFTNTYVATEQLIVKKNSPLYYQYYIQKDGLDLREVYYNFDYTGSDNTLAERRLIIPTTNTVDVADILVSSMEQRRQPVFKNSRTLLREVLVTWTCDLRPAYYTVSLGDTLFDIQGTDHIFDPATIYTTDGLWMNGPATDAWTTWGMTLRLATYKQMFDDGTHGDAIAGDHIYAVQFTYGPDSTGEKKFVGQVFKFGIRGGDNEGGKGGFGNNHIENIDDSKADVTIASQFGAINPKYYRGWNYDTQTPTGVEPLGGIPVVYRLDQNYPNPFNPSTNIVYSVPKAGWVTLKVYNMLGQQMTTLVSGPAEAGSYRVTFDAAGFDSGVYMYELRVGDFREMRKMTLVK